MLWRTSSQRTQSPEWLLCQKEWRCYGGCATMCRMCGYYIDVISTSSHSLRDTSEFSRFWTVELLLKILLLKREEMGEKWKGLWRADMLARTLHCQCSGGETVFFRNKQNLTVLLTSPLSSAPKQTSKTAHCHQFFFLLSDEKLTEKPKSPSQDI